MIKVLQVKTATYSLFRGDALRWLEDRKPNSLHAVVTDPPYGLLEYRSDQLEKMKNGHGGVWRIPPAFDGAKRRPLPRFTVLTESDKESLSSFFQQFAAALVRPLVPGAHVFIASNPIVAHLLYPPFLAAGFEPRGQVVRVVQTLRGGDRPKNAHEEFREVTVMPKSCWEPWLLFRKPCEGRVQDNLRKWGTGGLCRISEREPFKDLIYSCPTRRNEHAIAPHPSLKPQAFLRQLVHASLPLGKGIILDPFMGSGSTVAAAEAVGIKSVGIELMTEYFELACRSIPQLAALKIAGLCGTIEGLSRPPRPGQTTSVSSGTGREVGLCNAASVLAASLSHFNHDIRSFDVCVPEHAHPAFRV